MQVASDKSHQVAATVSLSRINTGNQQRSPTCLAMGPHRRNLPESFDSAMFLGNLNFD